MMSGGKIILTALAASTMLIGVPAYAGGGGGDHCGGRDRCGGSSGGSTSVPEPGALGLMAAGLFATGLMMHRKRKAAADKND